jgi:hypothetical protein
MGAGRGGHSALVATSGYMGRSALPPLYTSRQGPRTPGGAATEEAAMQVLCQQACQHRRHRDSASGIGGIRTVRVALVASGQCECFRSCRGDWAARSAEW